MPTPLEEYTAFIDALVERCWSASARWVRAKKPWPDSPENKAINDFLSTLSDSQREVLAGMLEEEKEGGFHDTLAYLNEEMTVEGLRLVRNGVEFPVEPFGTEMHYDFICRRKADPWPEPDNGDDA